ncbi:putative DD41D transposase [Trichonephila clavipes]|nr:putative DD41D transposase [Trichonephila clavipes]
MATVLHALMDKSRTNLFYIVPGWALRRSRSTGLRPIHFEIGLAIHQNDHQARRIFVEWAQNEIAVVPDLNKRILFSDEAHFWLNGYVNKQNCRIWSEANPQVYVETPLHLEKLTVWCALWAGGIIGPYFFKNDEGHNVTSLVYADKPQTLGHLEDNIRRVVADIRPQMLEKVIENWTSGLDYIRASRGSPMPEIIFKIEAEAKYQTTIDGLDSDTLARIREEMD